VTVQVRVGREQVVVVEAEGSHELRRRVGVGRRVPLHAGASGRAILAHLAPAEIEDYLSRPLEQVRPTTETNPAALAGILETIRANGYATSEQETAAGVVAISVPVFGADGIIAGSLSISGPQIRLGSDVRDRVIPLIREAGWMLSRAMGHRTPELLPDLVTA
jgi:DNA-binding IclR family transcriptional regulator